MIQILRLAPVDAMRLRAIRMAALRDTPDAFASTIQEAEGRTEDEWARGIAELPTFVAVLDGADVGLVRGAPIADQPSVAFLISLWVAPIARRKGVGDLLIDAVVAWARKQGIAQLILDVGDENLPAIALYERKGFKPTGETSTLPAPREHIHEHRRAIELS